LEDFLFILYLLSKMFFMIDLELKIKEKLDEYLEFDSNLLFEGTDYLVIFGGAIRDIIADRYNRDIQIHDIDIMCLPQSFARATENIKKYGYEFIELSSIGALSLYDLNHVIFEPHTYMNANRKIIQFIRPNSYEIIRKTKNIILQSRIDYESLYYEKLAFFELLSNVDLSCCGVFWNGHNLYESIPNSVNHCIDKKYQKLSNNIMVNSNRIHGRTNKLDERGWKQIYESRNDLQKNRALKINEILSDYPQIDNYKQDIGFFNLKMPQIRFDNPSTCYDSEDLPF